ncbi:MAG: hypothetical protein ABI627_30235 [Polyangiaceae bacterium]
MIQLFAPSSGAQAGRYENMYSTTRARGKSHGDGITRVWIIAAELSIGQPPSQIAGRK